MRIDALSTVMISAAVIGVLYGCSPDKKKNSGSWTKSFKGLGTLSSPRVADLNGDGVLDVVLGAGTVEFHASDSAVLALDGNDGSVLWMISGRDQMFGSACFKDVTGDQVADVFIGGRAAQLKAVDGRSGELMWEYSSRNINSSQRDSGTYNFYNPQFIPDQDGDGIEDIIVAAGGYVKALPYDPARPAGRLLVISSATGILLASATMPDGKEIYMSAVVAKFRDEDLSVVFGTGGETIGGSLYKVSIRDVLGNDLSGSVLLESGSSKGFIAPPVLADITEDGVPDIIANAVDGRMIAVDGETNEVLWRVSFNGTEAYCSIAAGYFTGDNIPDFFTNYGVGVWPDLYQSIQFMVDGKSGEVMFRDSLGTFQESSPVAVDYNNDGYDDVLFSINELHRSGYSNRLMVIDFHRDTVYSIGPSNYGANVSSTPWAGDLDADGYLDIVYCHEVNPFDLLSVTHKQGLKVARITTQIPVVRPVNWGAYMGSSYNGILSNKP